MRVVIALLILLSPMMAYGSECVTIGGKVYCEQEQQTVKLGNVELKVKDPKALLRAAKKSKSGFRKVSLYTDYHYVPVVEELAKQNDMEYLEFISYMVEKWDSPDWNPFLALYELDKIYNEIPAEYKGIVLDQIVNQIVSDVERSLGG